MADSKITALTAKTTLELTDLIPIVDMTGTPTTKKITVANMLISLGLRRGYNVNNTADNVTGWAVVFPSALGSAVDGSDYTLVISCWDALNPTETIAYTITSRTQNGFNILPIANAYIEVNAILN